MQYVIGAIALESPNVPDLHFRVIAAGPDSRSRLFNSAIQLKSSTSPHVFTHATLTATSFTSASL